MSVRMLGPTALAFVTALAMQARADDARGADARDVPLLARLARSPAERHRDTVNERTHALERLIRALPDVLDATAALSLADPASTPLDQPLAAPRVALVLHVRGAGPDDARLRALAQSVVHDLSASDLTIIRQSARELAKPMLARVGPFEVRASSATSLRTVLALSLAGNALLAALLLYRARPNRPRRPFVDRHGRGGPRA